MMSRSWHVLIALLIATLVCVPPLVRATQKLDSAASSSSLSIRLNRGFDAPETKCKVPPPAASSLRPFVDDEVAPPLEVTQGYVDVVAFPVSQYESSPDALRGPPSFLA